MSSLPTISSSQESHRILHHLNRGSDLTCVPALSLCYHPLASDGAVQISVVSTATGKEVFSETTPGAALGRPLAGGQPGPYIKPIKAVYLGSFKKKDKTEGYRCDWGVSTGCLIT